MRETILNMGIEETVADDAESSRLPRLYSAERDSSSMQEQSSNTVVERKIQNQSRPAAVVGISVRYCSAPVTLLHAFMALTMQGFMAPDNSKSAI